MQPNQMKMMLTKSSYNAISFNMTGNSGLRAPVFLEAIYGSKCCHNILWATA
jgi:hypothetical protein